ncbi:hypothetical protein K458DRAFT_134759 [Lentithecium fluviatile CBS 122367]|uniref:Alpha/beta-hydrolase n=1 Tax=Lentithecium fluviatile CBS 122367 TaxID=1168545 RepID=A0A6G1IL96_9PLEO|nr:hypothetical protein K458DRAFT_134759 [Lentithecium fluviatile CBS 122367]
MAFSAVFAIVAVSVTALTATGPLHARQYAENQAMIYNFAELAPTPELEWTPCYNNFTCALLEVPLDYTDTSIGITHLAIIRLSAQNDSAEDLLVNPGGPAASGVDMVLQDSSVIKEKVGSQYNLIGIDPRGVKNSGPDVTCFPGYPPAGRNAFYAEAFSVPDDTSAYGLAMSFQTLGAYGNWCTGIYSVDGTAKYVGTVAVAQDFLHYIELAAQAKGREPSDAKLNYYGISYGTVIGATFASLFPDRISHMVLDGVMDAEDYYSGGLETSVQDSDEAVRAFFRSCFEAGSEHCAFHGNANSWEELEDRYNAILDALKQSPIAVADSFAQNTIPFSLIPAVMTWQDLVSAVFSYVYSPVGQFPVLARILAKLEDGDASGLYVMNRAARIASTLDAGAYDDREARTLISCLDANGRFNLSTIEQYTDFVASMKKESQYGGLAVAGLVGPICRNLDVSPPESQLFTGTPSANRTSAPILFIGNTADPVTPLASAQKMARLFPGSTVLTVNISGHTQYGVASTCVNTFTQHYFLDARLPSPDTVCEVDKKPFVDSRGNAAESSVVRRWVL